MSVKPFQHPEPPSWQLPRQRKADSDFFHYTLVLPCLELFINHTEIFFCVCYILCSWESTFTTACISFVFSKFFYSILMCKKKNQNSLSHPNVYRLSVSSFWLLRINGLEHSCTHLSVHTCVHFSQVCISEWNSWVTGWRVSSLNRYWQFSIVLYHLDLFQQVPVNYRLAITW